LQASNQINKFFDFISRKIFIIVKADMTHVLEVLGGRVEVRPSRVHGRGAFAARACAAGELLLVEYGLVFRRVRGDAANELRERDRLLCFEPLLRELWPRYGSLVEMRDNFLSAAPVMSDKPSLQVAVAAMSHAAQQKINANAFRLGVTHVESAASWCRIRTLAAGGDEAALGVAADEFARGEEYSFLSYKACAFNHNGDAPNCAFAFDVSASGSTRIAVCALRDIAPGEELFFDYGEDRTCCVRVEDDLGMRASRLRARLVEEERILRRLEQLRLGPCSPATRALRAVAKAAEQLDEPGLSGHDAATARHMPIAYDALLLLFPEEADLMLKAAMVRDMISQ
jgi:hypothetical protein